MARSIDHSKLEKVKQSAMQLIVKKGYGGASIASIAKKAKVAEGYLYRFFKSKEELTLSLLNSKINDIADSVEKSLEQSSSVKDIVSFVVNSIFDIAKHSNTDIKFMYVMMSDYNFNVHSELKERIANLYKEAIERGRKSNQLDINVGVEELFIFTVLYPIQYINLRLKNFFGSNSWNEEDINKVIQICTKTLKC